jgi:hypothetical protein
MKLSSFSRTSRSLAMATLLSWLPPGPAQAQSKPESTPSQADAPARLDLELPASTLDRTAEDLQKQYRAVGQPANVLLKGGSCSLITTPKISLQRVTFEQAIRTVALMASPAVTVQGDPKALVIDTEAYQPKLRKVRVFNVAAFLRAEDRRTDDEKKRKVEELRYEERLHSLLSAVEKGIKISQQNTPQLEPPKLELEDSAGLLFASGEPAALEIVSEVVRALCYPQGGPQAKP